MKFPTEPNSDAAQTADAHSTMTPSAPRRLAALHAAVDARLAALIPSPRDEHDAVTDALRAAVLSPGKRIRPLLMLATVCSFGRDPLPVVDLACAIELVHAASLVLDDLPCMDDARTRRGRPALHRQFGQDVAVLAAVALLSLAYRTVAAMPALDPTTRSRLVVVLADAVGVRGLVQGQFRDLHPSGVDVDPDHAADTNQLKTGALIGVAFEFAALVTGYADSTRVTLRACAWHLGQAFQLLDDLKDRRLEPVDGKDVDQDLGKPTLLALLRPPAARRKMQNHLQDVDELLNACAPESDVLRALLTRIFGAATLSRNEAGADAAAP